MLPLTHKPNRPEPMLVVHLSGIPLYSSLLVLPTNIRLGWKGLRGINTLGYYKEKFINYDLKKFNSIG